MRGQSCCQSQRTLHNLVLNVARPEISQTEHLPKGEIDLNMPLINYFQVQPTNYPFCFLKERKNKLKLLKFHTKVCIVPNENCLLLINICVAQPEVSKNFGPEVSWS